MLCSNPYKFQVCTSLMTSFRGNHCGHQQKVFKWFRGDLLVVGESAFFKDFTRLAVVSALLQCLLK